MVDLGSSEGAMRIEQERRRQILEEGFTAAHDEEHVFGELSGAASCYARTASRQIGSELYRAEVSAPPCQEWRWSHEWWKPSEDPIRNLEKAGALIAAEIDRLLRDQEKAGA
jgi:hypothetical protein